MRLTGKMEGEAQFDRALGGLIEDFEDNQPTLEEIAERGFYPIMQEIFDTEGRGRWMGERMSSDYLRRKRAIYGDKPILQAAGSLMRSLTRKRAAGNVHVGVGPHALLVGSDLPQARPQDRRFGIIELTSGDVEHLADVAEESMKDRAEERGFKAR